jgi:hypothetical protein
MPHLTVVHSVLLGLIALCSLICLVSLVQMLHLLYQRLARCEERLAALALLLGIAHDTRGEHL